MPQSLENRKHSANTNPGSSFESRLPAQAYTEADYLRRERNSTFSDNWIFVGFGSEIASPGDLMPISFAGIPILLVRDASGGINAFHNVCRHRCMKLVDAPGNHGRAIRCPYHSWTYDLSGRLRAAPYFGGPSKQGPDGFDRRNYGLHPIRTAVWHDWIFVNLSGTAPDFEDYAAPLRAMLAGLDLDRIKPIGSIDFGVVNANWKFLMENFIEPYHVQFLHRKTTSQPLLDHYTIANGPCLGSAVDISRTKNNRSGPATLDVSSRYLTLFPNFVLGWYFPDQLGVYQNVPLAPGATWQRRMLYHADAENLDEGRISELKKLWYEVHKEDHWVCERLQLGFDSPVARAGSVLSPHWEAPVRDFQELVLASYEGMAEHACRR